MAVINLPASKSLTLSNKIPKGNILERILVVGNKGKCIYYSYLYFDTNIINNNSLISATLVLFKVANFSNCPQQKFAIYPLLKEFSSYTTYLHDCPVDPTLEQVFLPFTNDAVIEVDITILVHKWLDNTLINKGIAIKKITEEQGRAFFGSAYCRNNTLIPFIRIIYKHERCYCLPISNITYSANVIPCPSK